jgi:hypothetical protein
LDPTAAALFVADAPTSKENYRIAMRALIVGWFRSRQPGLEEYIRAMEPSIQRQRALTTYFKEMIRRDGLDGAIRWAEALPDTEQMDRKYKLSAHRRLMSELARSDMDIAIEWCDAQCDGPFGDGLRGRLVQIWAAYDTDAARAWLVTQPAGEQRDAATVMLFETWMVHDRDALASYMAGLTRQGMENVPRWIAPFAASYALWISWDYPEKALSWAELIEPEQKRRTTRVTIVRRWLNQDEPAAEAWIEQSSFTQDERDRARTFPPRWKRNSIPVPEA